MKIAYILLVIILAVIVCGCTASAPAAAPSAPMAQTLAAEPAAAIPNLTGTWTGPMKGYDEGTGFSDYPDLKITMMVTEQHGRIFAGDLTFATNGTETKSGFAGAIGRDGRTLSITEEHGGYSTGEILAADEMELTYMDDNSPYSVAIDSFKRVQG
jgi:hypothetical protein